MRGGHRDVPVGGGRRRFGLPRNFQRNALTAYMRSGSTAAISLLMTPVLIAGLGMEAFGIWVVVNSLSAYRDLLQLGFLAVTPKEVAERHTFSDREGLRTAVATLFWILMGLGLIALVVGLGLVAAFPHLFEVSPDLRGPAQTLLLIMVLDFAISIPTNIFNGTLVGIQRWEPINVMYTAVAVLQAVGWAIALAIGGGLVTLGLITLALNLAGKAWLAIVTRRLVPGFSIAPGHVDPTLVRPFAGLSVWFAISDATHVLISRIDVVVVGLVLGVGPAGVYGVGQRIALALAQFVEPVVGFFLPHSSELTARRDAAGLRASLLGGTRILVAIATPLAVALAVLAGPILDAWVGTEFDGAIPVAALLSAAVVVWMISDTGMTMLMGSGQGRRPALIRVGEAALNLALSVALANAIGLEGVALATLIAAAAANLLVACPYVCRRFDLRVTEFARVLLVAHAPPTLLALLVGWLVTRADPSGLLEAGAAAALIVVSYLALFAVTGLDGAERHAIVARLRPPAQSSGASS